jgi:hypothetical protein
MDKVVLARLQMLIDRLQVMNGLLAEVGDASGIRVILTGSDSAAIELSPEDQDFSTVLSVVKSIASLRADEIMTEIEGLLISVKL